MKNNTLLRNIVLNGLVLALYATLALPFASLNYGIINIRMAEILTILAIYSKKYFPGLVLGCLVVNIFSSMPLDIIFGTLQTLLACFILYYIKNKQLAVILAALSCGLIIGFELFYFLQYEVHIAIFSVFLSELIILEFGYFLFKAIFKNKSVADLLLN